MVLFGVGPRPPCNAMVGPGGSRRQGSSSAASGSSGGTSVVAALRAPPPPCVVYGAGTAGTDDAPALQRALDDPACVEVVLPAGRVLVASALFVRRSDVTLTIEGNATLQGLPALLRRDICTGSELNEFNWSDWCTFISVTSERNFTLRGSGTIAPGGTGGKNPDIFSALHVRSTAGVRLQGVRIHCTTRPGGGARRSTTPPTSTSRSYSSTVSSAGMVWTW